MFPRNPTFMLSLQRARGVTLIELMVGMLVAMVATVVIFQVLAVSESYKRTTTGGSDALQNGSFSAFTLNRIVRGGGSNFASVPNALGCPLGVFRDGAQLFGQTTTPFRISAPTLPEPFETALAFKLTLVPALIIAGADDDTPDTLVVMSGNHSSMGRYAWVSTQTDTNIGLIDDAVLGINNTNSAGNSHDLLLAVDQDSGSGRGASTTCDIAEALDTPSASTPFTVTSPIKLVPTTGTAHFTGPDAFTNNGSYYSTSLAVTNLGSVPAVPTAGSGPQFVMIGVGNDGQTPNALVSLNLITGYDPDNAAWVTQSLADNVITMKAIYGVATNALDPGVSSWVAPSGTWAASTLSATRTDLQKLRAIRIAIITRNAQPEKHADDDSSTTPRFSPASFTLFGDTAASISVTNPDRHYRYKVFDVTIPLRNMVLMTQNP